MSRTADVTRETAETAINVHLEVDGTGTADIDTGIGFLNHMLQILARHARFDVRIGAVGDLGVDDHHTSEDCALALGGALDLALAERERINRFGWAYAPLDEALARSVVDLSGRALAHCQLGLQTERLGEWGTQNVAHFFASMAQTGRFTLHVDVIRGANDHHRCEAAFKATALALRQAVESTGTSGIPSTKGVL